jgi:hypothetical protein
VPNAVYWLSIQAVVGHDPCCPTCPPIPSPPIIQDFWGWHTTPPGYNRKDDAFMGMLGMGCRGEWIYRWMNHLHWSTPPYNGCADDPTKSINMAFYLINVNPNGLEEILWCQPISPGPPTIPPPPPSRPYPEGGIDELVDTNAVLTADIAGFGMVTLGNLQGGTLVRRSNPTSGGPVEMIQTEMLSMSLTGNGPFGLARVIERPDMMSNGQTQGPGGSPYPSQSFFDVFVEIQQPGAPPGLQNLITHVPARVDATVAEVPPTGVFYQGNYPPGQVQLFDRSNPAQPIGELRSVFHRVNDRRGIDIHSDIDWRFAPMKCVCKGDTNEDGRLNSLDIQQFIDCLLMPPLPANNLGCPCDCADMTGDGLLILSDDGPPFVALLLASPKPICP